MQTYQGGWAVIDAQGRIVARAQAGKDAEPAAPEGGRVVPIIYALPAASDGWLLGGADTAAETVERDADGKITSLTLTFGLVADPWAWPSEPGDGPFAYALVQDGAVARIEHRARPWRQSQVPAGETWLPLTEVRPALAAGQRYGTASDEIGEDRVIRTWSVETVPIEELRKEAQAEVDRQAEAARLAWITPGAGQAMEYERTGAEAERIASDADPQPEDYPMLAAEQAALAAVGVGKSLAEIGQIVRAEAAAWTQAGAAIKRIRRAAKLRIAAAESAALIEGIIAGLTWPSPGA